MTRRTRVSLAAMVLIACAIAAAMSGCGRRTSETSDGKSDARFGDPIVYRDAVTGCEYLTTVNDITLTPRVEIDGKSHAGCGVKP